MAMVFVLMLLCCLLSAARGKSVLLVSVGFRGHATPLLRIGEELLARGHDIRFATHDSMRDEVFSSGATFLSLGALEQEGLRSQLEHITTNPSKFRGILSIFNEVYLPTAIPTYDALLPELQRDAPDLLVIDIGTLGAVDIANKLSIPFVINSPTLLFDGATSYIPAWGTGFSVDMSLWDRCMNVLFPRLLSVALTPPFMHVNKLRWDAQLPPHRSQHDMFRGARILVNTAFGLEYPRPSSPLVDMVGPLLPPAVEGEPRVLPPLISTWLEGGGQDVFVVYVSLGSLPRLEPWQAQALVEGLTDARFRVLWTVPNDQRGALPAAFPPSFRVKTLGGVPHLDVLAHPFVHVVISHCGMASAQEALYHHIPVLCIPFFCDQPDVSARIADSGAGLSVNKRDFDAEEVRAKVLSLKQNRSFSEAAAEVGALLRGAGGTERAADIIESTLVLGTAHLETADLTLPFHKLGGYDICAVFVAILCCAAVGLRGSWAATVFATRQLKRGSGTGELAVESDSEAFPE